MDWDQAVAVSLVHQNSVPSVQMHRRITAILRAMATRAFFDPMRRASRVPSCLEGRPALHFREKDAGSLTKGRCGKSVPAFRYPAVPVRYPDWISSRRQPEIGPTSRARLNLFGSSIVERNARAVTGLTPGTVMNRRNVRSSRTKRRSPCPKPPPWQRQPPALRSICR